MISSREVGIVKGCDCGGIEVGRGGNLVGAGRTRRGACRRGSTLLRYEVKTSGRSRGLRKGMSRLDNSQL